VTPSPSDPAPFVALIEDWLSRARAENPVVAAVDRDPEQARWFVRMRGEEKLVTTVWLTLGDRTLQHETYFMPAPEENVAQCYEYLLRVNARLHGTRFSIGPRTPSTSPGRCPSAGSTTTRSTRSSGPRTRTARSASAPPCASASRRAFAAERVLAIATRTSPSCTCGGGTVTDTVTITQRARGVWPGDSFGEVRIAWCSQPGPLVFLPGSSDPSAPPESAVPTARAFSRVPGTPSVAPLTVAASATCACEGRRAALYGCRS